MTSDNISYLKLLGSVEDAILSGGKMQSSEAEYLLNAPEEYLVHILAAADRIRIQFKGNKFDSCSLINARAGLCGEDCSFCAQSAHHETDCDTHPLCSAKEILEAALAAKHAGAARFCTVTSGGALSDEEFETLLDSLAQVHATVDINLDASLGFLDDHRAQRLRAAGVTRYNHNVETSRDHYANICSTHTFDQRLDTVRTSIRNGISACCGGIIGLGETPTQRLAMAYELEELEVDCVPINILNPRPGTPLEHAEPLTPLEILKTIAIFRLVLPDSTIKVAGGREKNLGDFQAMALRSGANGMIIGGYLTTAGRTVEEDIKMVREAGYTLE